VSRHAVRAAPRHSAEYILPLRWTSDTRLGELVSYLEQLRTWIDVTVVDGSADSLFERHGALFPPAVRHIRPDPGHGAVVGANGKVTAVMTAVRVSDADLLVIADDDVRYTRKSLAAVVSALDEAHVVRPQNYFTPLPWHASWDTARTLINRCFGADFPGTMAIRREALLATGGYDAVLFENLELIRTVTAAGGRELQRPELFVARRPPTAHHFLRQRVRQAYDDFAQPTRLGAELALLPLLASLLALPHRQRLAALAGFAGPAIALAETGRRRHGGRSVFPARASWYAPLWAAERAVCIWLAVAVRLSGGVRYSGSRIRVAAHSPSELRRRHQGKISPYLQTQTGHRSRSNYAA
jgi:hypothetical protein